MSNVSRSSCVGSDARHARNSWRKVVGRRCRVATPFRSPLRDEREVWAARQRGPTGDLRRAFDEGDFLGCELVEFIHKFINLLVGGGDGVLQHGLF